MHDVMNYELPFTMGYGLGGDDQPIYTTCKDNLARTWRRLLWFGRLHSDLFWFKASMT